MRGKKRNLFTTILILSGIATAQNCLVLEPTGISEWTLGQNVVIRWDPGAIPANHLVKIRLRNKTNTEVIFAITPQGQHAPNTGSFPWKVPNTITPGQYIVRINDTQSSASCDSAIFKISPFQVADLGNRPGDIPPGSLAQGVLKKPDLWIYWNLPHQFRPNTTDTTVFRVGVKNLGNEGSPACPFVYTISRSAGYSKSIRLQVPRIKPGGMELLRFQFKFTEGGIYSFTGIVDPQDEVTESEENNNKLVKVLDVAADVKPDLIVQEVVTPYHCRLGSTQPVWGKVKNIGKHTSPPVVLHIKCSPKVKERTRTLPSLRPGHEASFEFGFEYHTLGTKRGIVWVDLADLVDELNEDNNSKTFSFKVLTGTIID